MRHSIALALFFIFKKTENYGTVKMYMWLC